MSENNNREEQFHWTPAVIDVVQQLPFDELNEMFRIQEGRDVRKEVNDSIMEHRAKKHHHPITEERYQFVEWLYWIRKQHGNHYGFLQPDFICIIFGKMMVSKYQRTDADICKAANAWCRDPVEATVKYGHISKWNTSMVTNMWSLFEWKRNFNDDISKWDVSSVTNMSVMFFRTPFSGDISGWDVSSVTDMWCMFQQTPFNGDISGWDVSSVTNMAAMFHSTPFNGDISGWDVSSVTDPLWIFSACPIPKEHKPVFAVSN